MKIRYSVIQAITYDGILDIEVKEYNSLKDKNEETIGQFILDHINLKYPVNYQIESVDQFEPINDPPMCDYCHTKHWGYQDHQGA